MKSQNKVLAQQQKSKELLTLANQLFATAKQLGEYHVVELKNNMAHTLNYAKTVANQDVTKLKALQVSVAADAEKRLQTYRSAVKTVLDQMEGMSADQYLKKARSTLSAWYKDAQKKVPQGVEQLGQVAHDIADTGMKAFKEGRKLVNDAAADAEKSVKKALKKEAVQVKKVVSKKPATKKPVLKQSSSKNSSTPTAPVKKVIAKKPSAKPVTPSQN